MLNQPRAIAFAIQDAADRVTAIAELKKAAVDLGKAIVQLLYQSRPQSQRRDWLMDREREDPNVGAWDCGAVRSEFGSVAQR